MTAMSGWDEPRALELVRRLVLRELQPGTPIPNDDEDLVKAGTIDSMGWVGILSGIEEATGIRNFGASWPEGRAQSIRALVDAVREGLGKSEGKSEQAVSPSGASEAYSVSVVGWGFSLGSQRISAAGVEQECDLPAGTILERAGIQSVSRATANETEVSLAVKAVELALAKASVEPDSVDVLVATSTTSLGFPSFAALLHSRLLLRESCAAWDVGGACVGLVHALAAAKGSLYEGRRRLALIVASEVNSRALARPGVPGEFRGLFGDGACAFVLSRSTDAGGQGFRVGEFVSGCSGAFASSLGVMLREKGELEVTFKGEQLASAAVATLNQVVGSLEDFSATPRSAVDLFAFHEPNPRLTEIFAQRAGIPLEKIARVAHTSGNLGSVTCGVNLCTALTRCDGTSGRTIFVAAVGPGLLWAGTYLS